MKEGRVLRQMNICGALGMLQEAFLLASQITQSRNSRITQMGFISKSPTANFQREEVFNEKPGG